MLLSLTVSNAIWIFKTFTIIYCRYFTNTCHLSTFCASSLVWLMHIKIVCGQYVISWCLEHEHLWSIVSRFTSLVFFVHFRQLLHYIALTICKWNLLLHRVVFVSFLIMHDWKQLPSLFSAYVYNVFVNVWMMLQFHQECSTVPVILQWKCPPMFTWSVSQLECRLHILHGLDTCTLDNA